MGSLRRKLRCEIINHEIIVEGGRKLHTMSGDKQQTLNFEGQEVLAQVIGPTQLQLDDGIYVSKMFEVFIPSLRGRFYAHENILQTMMAKGEV